MKSFVIKIADLFLMDSKKSDDFNFNTLKRRLVIPVYQREYKWEDDRIFSLLSDINQNSKFIGNIILDEKEQKYEIVDGQQRLTTCFLTLVALFNHYCGHSIEQKMIKQYLTPFGIILLENDSIGDYLILSEDKCHLEILDSSDIYGQKEDFIRAFKLIDIFINSLDTNKNISVFKNKLLDSEILVLINDQHDTSHPVEQLFLDINEKAQLLKVEDIFKGHCFEKFEAPLYQILRNKWAELKRNANLFKKYGFEDTSEYIYTFLLETDNTSLPKNLKKSGRHYIEDKTMDEINALLDAMITFGTKVNQFYISIKSVDYRFDDLCNHSHDNTSDHLGLKQMCLSILEQEGAIYQKLPFMFFVQHAIENNNVTQNISHDALKRIITNLYIYAGLFILNEEKKSKSLIDQSVKNALTSFAPIKDLIEATKTLRNKYLDNFLIRDSYSFEKLSFICSVIDKYNSNGNWLNCIYAIENNHNLEHFIIPQKKKGIIKWKDENSSFNIEPDYNFVKKYKKHVVNQLVMDKDLNEQLENYDIVYKIEKIKEWYSVPNVTIPKHIKSTIDSIEKMPTYIALREAKEQKENADVVKERYHFFMSAYFCDTEIDNNKKRIRELFIRAFRN